MLFQRRAFVALRVTAVCVSIDRILQNTAPICCLPFDGIGVRHPGITHGAGARSPARSTFPLSCHPQKPRAYPPCAPRLTNNTSDRKANGEIRFLACWRSTCGEAVAGMPGCRTPIRSKGKQRVGAVSCGIRSIETQIAVNQTYRKYVRVSYSKTHFFQRVAGRYSKDQTTPLM